MADNIQFNEKLKFSWGHIIAVLALIGIAYCTFVGTVYLLKGQFLLSGIITAVITLLIASLFFIPQQLKATEQRFEKRIKWERAFIFSSPVLFILLMIPFSHAWTVHHRQDQILSSFNQIIAASDNMFKEYETYCSVRKINYKHTLDARYRNTGADSITILNKQAILDLVLLSSNYDTLKSASKAWMNKSLDPNISTWNVFLLGNISGIQKAIHSWYDDLQKFSETKLNDEEDTKVFDQNSQFINAIDADIESLTSNYSNILGFSPMTLLWLALSYAMLLFPYLLQNRHTKTVGTNWTLFGFKNKKPKKSNKSKFEGTSSKETSTEESLPDDTAPDKDEAYESFLI